LARKRRLKVELQQWSKRSSNNFQSSNFFEAIK